ncbi:MAG: bifunctional UDP-N-acetylmuramoyl-tripeptide:D-alanyl-D-alanine ligase/alanine racemase [Bacteroidota bacterium]|nr:bifunctional UDP-N-acetylmuramoyl-tripeptide:D-alanyl-D-alanine ligase/alanine racemase [Bacteroidota bacterium]
MNYSVSALASIFQCTVVQEFSHLTIQYVEFDSRYMLHPEKSVFFALQGDHTNGHQFIPNLIDRGVKVFVCGLHFPDKSYPNAVFLKVPDPLIALQHLAAFHRSQFTIPIIGITGSNGKTIVKEWLSQILQSSFTICKNPKSYNSQLGVALSLLELDSTDQMGIFEAGISTTGEMQQLFQMMKPDIGLITNIGDAHSIGFQSLEEKINEKLLLFSTCKKIIYCRDYTRIHEVLADKKEAISWSLKEKGTYYFQHTSTQQGKQILSMVYQNEPVNFEVPFYDFASIENIIHCIVCSLELNIPIPIIQESIKDLQGLSMRLEQKEGWNGCVLINDSYSLDFQSLQLALRFVEQQNQQLPRTLLLTDFQQQHSSHTLYRKVVDLIKKYQIRRVIAIGSEIGILKKHLPESVLFHPFQTTEALLEHISSLSLKNELILIKGARKFQLERFFNEYSKSKHDTILEIDLKALLHNLHEFKKRLDPHTKIMAVVKAAAYGTGHYEIARFMEHKGIDYLSVAYPDEGILLREKGIQLPIMVMNTGSCDFNLLMEYKLEPELFSLPQCQRFSKEMGAFTAADIHIKLDTGMHRLGFLPSEMEELKIWLSAHPSYTVKSIFSHLSGSDSAEHDTFTNAQAEVFITMYHSICEVLGYKPDRHLLNSSGIIRHKNFHYEMVRIGIGLYGIDPDPIFSKKLEKVHTLKARITQIKTLDPGETVSYNRSGKINQLSKIAILSIGYADGLPRNAGLKGYELQLLGKKYALKGVVCMDMCMLDISGLDHVHEGMEVEVFGKNIPIETLAAMEETISYEILCGISPRVKRIFLQD